MQDTDGKMLNKGDIVLYATGGRSDYLCKGKIIDFRTRGSRDEIQIQRLEGSKKVTWIVYYKSRFYALETIMDKIQEL